MEICTKPFVDWHFRECKQNFQNTVCLNKKWRFGQDESLRYVRECCDSIDFKSNCVIEEEHKGLWQESYIMWPKVKKITTFESSLILNWIWGTKHEAQLLMKIEYKELQIKMENEI